jgi:hypothetical protein
MLDFAPTETDIQYPGWKAYLHGRRYALVCSTIVTVRVSVSKGLSRDYVTTSSTESFLRSAKVRAGSRENGSLGLRDR